MFMLGNVAYAQYPNGTLILMTKEGPVGKIAQRMTGDYYTHIAIII